MGGTHSSITTTIYKRSTSMFEPRPDVAGLLSGPATLLTSAGRALRTPWLVAALLLLCLAVASTEPFAGPLLAQETDDCDYVWCATATVKTATGSAGEVGYKPGADHPGSTLEPAGFTYGEVSYTVGGIVSDHTDASVTLLLSPLPDADTVRPLTLSVGGKVLVFAEGTRSEPDGAYTWTDSAKFGAADTPFVDGASIGLTISEDALPGAPNLYLAHGGGGDRVTLIWNPPAHSGARSITGYRVEVSEDSGSTWETVAEDLSPITFVHNGLLADTTYRYRVSAINSIGVGEHSATVSASTGAGRPPREPTDLSAVPEGGSVTLSWEPPIRTGGAEISGYRIETSTDGETWTELVDSVTGTTYTHTGLTGVTTYSYRVAARNSFGLRFWSATATAATGVLAPGAPQSLAAAAAGTAITLSWSSPASDGGATISGYRIETSTDGDTWTELENSVSGTTHTHSGLTDGLRYSYRVAARNSEGLGPWSETVTAVTRVLAPGVPLSLAAAAAGTAINLSWDAPASDGGGEVTSYRIETSPDGDDWSELVSSVAGTTYADTGLTVGTTHYYRVAARNSAGLGTASAAVSETARVVAPGAPLNLAAAAAGTAINLSWDAPASDGGADVTSYRIETSTDGDDWTELISTVAGTTYADTGLTIGTTHYYRVAARNSAGLGTASAAVSQTARVVAPGAPLNLAAVSHGTTINLSWDAPASDGGAEVTSYRIDTSVDGDDWSELVSSVTGTTYADTGLTIGTTYYYQVTARNSAGLGAASAAVSQTAQVVAPGAPLQLAAAAHGTTMNLSWDVPEDDGGADVTSYLIETSTDGDGWTELVSSVAGTTYADTGLTVGTTHYYRVAARNSAGLGTPSEAVSQTAQVVAPGAPEGLAAAAHGITINLSWDQPASDGGGEISGYRIESSPDEDTWTNLATSVTGTTYAHTGLELATTYHYRVSASNSTEEGPASETATATTATALYAPGAPQNPAASAHGTTMNLSWDAPASDGGAEVSGYRIETGTDGDAWTELVSSVTGTTYADTGLTIGTTYYYQVTARNSVGLGATSDAVSATVIANLPGAPHSLSAASGGRTSINLSWDAPDSDGGSSITGYGIETSADASDWSSLTGDTGSTDTSYVHDGLAASTTVHYRVSAISAAGDGPASATASATTDPLTVPGAPHITSADAELDGLYILVPLTIPEDNGGTKVTGYRIEGSEGTGELSWVVIADNYRGFVYPHEGISPGATWHHRISAINSVGVGAPSNVVTVTMPSIAPGPPQNLTATAGAASVDLSWEAPASDGGADVTGYSVEASTDQASWDELESSTTELSHSHTGFAGKTTYYYRVSAINSVGTGSPSDTASATSPAVAPGPPRNLSVTTEGTRFDLSWEAPASDGGADVTGYRIEISTDEEPWRADEDTPTGLSHSLTGLVVEVTYYFRVSAINSAGTGSPSAVESGVSSCDVWCATVTVMNLAGSTNFVGYGPAILYPDSTLEPDEFTYGDVDYTVDAFFNKRDAGTVFVALTPALTESAKSALVLHIGTSRLPFGSAISAGAISQWVPSTINLSNFGFADGATLSIEITASEEEEEGGEEE